MYKLTLYATQENEYGEFITPNIVLCTESSTKEEVKTKISDLIWKAIELKKLTKDVLIEITIEENNEYNDSEEFIINIEKIAYVDETFSTIDREQSVVLLPEGEKLQKGEIIMEKIKTKRLHISMAYTFVGDTGIDIPLELLEGKTENEQYEIAYQYAQEHIGEIPVTRNANYVADSDNFEMDDIEWEEE